MISFEEFLEFEGWLCVPDALYRTAFARPPGPAEQAAAARFVADAHSASDRQRAWSDLCHVLFNVVEFSYLY